MSHGQYSVSGQLVDKQSGDPLTRAHIGIIGSDRGTVSNENGYFIFNYPSQKKNSILKISHLGYTPILINLSEVDSKINARFSMTKSVRELNEILITDSEDTIKLIVRQAILSLRKNLPSKSFSAKGFYREYDKQDGKYVRLVESAVTQRDKGYDNNIHQGIKLRVDELRKSEDNIDLDWRSAISNWFYDHNGLYKLLEEDPFRKKDRASNFFERIGDYALTKDPNIVEENYGSFRFISSKDFMEGYDFSLVETIIEDSNKYHRIKFENPYVDKTLMVGSGELLIDSSDNMIIEFKAFLKRTNKKDGMGLILTTFQTIVSKYQYKFKKIGKKYYLYYAESMSLGSNSSIFRRNEKNYRSNESGLIYKHKQYLINKITKNKVNRKQTMADDDDIYNEDVEYNVKFWDEYNIIVDLPLEKKLKQDLTEYID